MYTVTGLYFDVVIKKQIADKYERFAANEEAEQKGIRLQFTCFG